jgi:hypothetical protein
MVIRIEAMLKTALPLLATKAGLAELRDDVPTKLPYEAEPRLGADPCYIAGSPSCCGSSNDAAPRPMTAHRRTGRRRRP